MHILATEVFSGVDIIIDDRAADRMKYSLTSGECCSPAKSPEVVIFPPRFHRSGKFLFLYIYIQVYTV